MLALPSTLVFFLICGVFLADAWMEKEFCDPDTLSIGERFPSTFITRESSKWHKCENHVIAEKFVFTSYQCFDFCHRQRDCKSFNVRHVEGERLRCVLLDKVTTHLYGTGCLLRNTEVTSEGLLNGVQQDMQLRRISHVSISNAPLSSTACCQN